MTKQITIPMAPPGMKLNTDGAIVINIIEALTKTEGMCPCVPRHLHTGPDKEDYKCVCKNARENKVCHCNLFIKV
jgi:ferredoxin-thioredoxin reductase catalytic subunit